MQHFQPLSAVIAALKDSTTLDVVDNDSCLQRKYPLSVDLKDKPMVEIQKVYEDKAMAKSIYAKGFGEEEPGTQFDVEAFFSEFGTTNSVRLRRTQQKSFKGSVFVEFDSEETQKNFLALDPKPKWKGKELLIKSKKQYCDDKVDDIQAGVIRPRSPDGKISEGKQGNKHHGNDDLDWKTRRENDRVNGFQDKRNHRGNRKGFGSSGQRGRGDRDRRGHRGDRHEEKRNEQYVSLARYLPIILLLTIPAVMPKLLPLNPPAKFQQRHQMQRHQTRLRLQRPTRQLQMLPCLARSRLMPQNLRSIRWNQNPPL